MRKAEDMIKDLRGLGRTDEQISIVASASHGGRLKDEVTRILALSPGEQEALLTRGRQHDVVEPQEPEVAEEVPEGITVPDDSLDEPLDPKPVARQQKRRML